MNVQYTLATPKQRNLTVLSIALSVISGRYTTLLLSKGTVPGTIVLPLVLVVGLASVATLLNMKTLGYSFLGCANR
jgi:hypothetical protein